MGADFILAAVEMPDVQRVDGQVGVLAAERIFTKLREALTEDVVNEIADTLDGGCLFIGDPPISDITDDIYESMKADLLGFWNGDWSRYYTTLDTFDKDGNSIVLTCSGDMSWGEVPESVEILWRFSMLQDQWWK